MVLTAQPPILVECERQVHLVAGGAELGLLMDGFQQGAPVKGGFRLDELAVDACEQWLLAEGKSAAPRGR